MSVIFWLPAILMKAITSSKTVILKASCNNILTTQGFSYNLAD